MGVDCHRRTGGLCDFDGSWTSLCTSVSAVSADRRTRGPGVLSEGPRPWAVQLQLGSPPGPVTLAGAQLGGGTLPAAFRGAAVTDAPPGPASPAAPPHPTPCLCFPPQFPHPGAPPASQTPQGSPGASDDGTQCQLYARPSKQSACYMHALQCAYSILLHAWRNACCMQSNLLDRVSLLGPTGNISANSHAAAFSAPLRGQRSQSAGGGGEAITPSSVSPSSHWKRDLRPRRSWGRGVRRAPAEQVTRTGPEGNLTRTTVGRGITAPTYSCRRAWPGCRGRRAAGIVCSRYSAYMESMRQGTFSRCYKLTDLSTSAVFALKVVPRGGAGGLRPRGKVEREIALHSRLRHRNIVAFHGHFSDRDHVYLVLEYCSRQSLAHVLKVRQTLTEPEVRYYLRGLVSGLRYLHQRRIVHRDLKPSNFFLNKSMEVKIGDLGLAARLGPAGRCLRVLCGTPDFQAPEVVSRLGHSCKSDIWALGCIMYTALMGTPPFTGAPLLEMYQNIRAAHYPEPTNLSPSARSLIARLLAPDPSERPSLDHLLQDEFFTQGFTPDRLPPHSCHSPPVFVFPLPLGRLFHKVGRLLTQCRPPCPFTTKEAPGPTEETEPDHTESASKKKTLLSPETRVHLLTHGTLRSTPTDPKGSRAPEVEAAIRKLLLCLDSGPLAALDPPGERKPALWAPEYVDYSSKYGFGYELSDGGSGMLFRDGSHMALRPPRGHVSYLPDRGTLQIFAARDMPSPLRAKLAVLRLFACYLQRRLREEGTMPRPTVANMPAMPGLCLLSFVADPQVLVLMLSNGTVQVSSKEAQMHLVLSGDGMDWLLTHWASGGLGAAVSSADVLWHNGHIPAIRSHLCHGLRLLQSL